MQGRDPGSGACHQPSSSICSREDLGPAVETRLQQAALPGAQREVFLTLARREPGHRPIRHHTIELSPNGGEFIVITQLIYAHNRGYTQICTNQTGVAARTKTWVDGSRGWMSRVR